jgi:hypothetical protein
LCIGGSFKEREREREREREKERVKAVPVGKSLVYQEKTPSIPGKDGIRF